MIYVKDLEQMAAFYGDALGLPIITATRTDTWVESDTGSATLALHAIPPHIAEQFTITTPPHPREENPIKIIFGVKDLESEYTRLKTLGVDLKMRPWGACDGIDPEGNIFQLRQVP